MFPVPLTAGSGRTRSTCTSSRTGDMNPAAHQINRCGPGLQRGAKMLAGLDTARSPAAEDH